MKARNKRIIFVILGLIAISAAGALITSALQQYTTYYYTPTKVVNKEAPIDDLFKLGGMVRKGSLMREEGKLEVEFVLTDYENDVKVRYNGILPDLFKEKQAAVTTGRLGADGVFVAEEVLAKHDESYMPPEVAESLKKEANTDSQTGSSTTSDDDKPSTSRTGAAKE
jgi:cytochrome c-type biogenesis protein CcmE